MRKTLVCALLLMSACGMVFAQGKSEESAPAGAGSTYILKYCSKSTAGGVQKDSETLFLDEIEKNANGRIKVERYVNGELASNAEDILALISTNAVQAGRDADMSLSWVAPEWISYTSVPFCFRDRNHMAKFFNSEVALKMNDDLIAKHGYRYLDNAIGMRGARMLTANKKITGPEGMKGIKFRVPNVLGTVASWEAMGAKVIGVPLSELFTSLQNGLVDAQENPYAQIEANGFYQVQKYIMETKHQYNAMYTYVNEEFWKSLPDDLKQVVLDANKKSFDYFNEKTDSDDERIKKVCLDAGCTIVPEKDIDIAAFKKLIQDKVLNSDVSKDWAKGGWEYIQSL